MLASGIKEGITTITNARPSTTTKTKYRYSHEFILGSLFVFGLLYAQNLAVSASIEFETYTNEDYDLSLDYPPDWNVVEENLPPYTAVSLQTDDSQKGTAEISVSVVSFPKSNRSFYEIERESGTNTGAIGDTTTRLIDKTNTTLAGFPAIQNTFYQYGFGASIKVMEIIAASNNTNNDWYNINYKSEPSNFDNHLPEFYQIVESFKVGLNDNT